MKKNIKSISFTDEYKREYEYIVTLPNASRYICELIRSDLDSKRSDLSVLKMQAIEIMNKIAEIEQKK